MLECENSVVHSGIMQCLFFYNSLEMAVREKSHEVGSC